MNATTMNIKIHYFNEIYMRIETERSIEYELREEFSFYTNNYQFNPKFKSGMWDGKIRLYNGRDKTLYTGLLYDLYQFAKRNGYSITVNEGDKAQFKPSVTLDECWIDKFNETMSLYKFKDYQRNAFVQAINHNKTLILSPTGSGKSFLLYAVVRYLIDSGHVDKRKRMLINVPNIGLVNQLLYDFKEYTIDGFDIGSWVTQAGGDNVEDESVPIVISTWQTSMRKPKEYFECFNAYALDEAHQATAKEITNIIDKLEFCKFKIGMTGTLDGTDMHELEMRARFGKLYRAATTKQLMDSGDLAKLVIDARVIKYGEDDITALHKELRGKTAVAKYKAEIDFIVEHELRNKYLMDTAFATNKNSLMLFNYVDKHGKLLLEKMLPHQDEHCKRVYFIYGGISGNEREEIRQVLDKKPPVWYDVYISNNEFVRIRGEKTVTLKDGSTVSGFDLSLHKKYELCSKWINTVVSNKLCYNTIELDDERVYKSSKIVIKRGSCILLASYGTLTVGINIKNLHTLILCHPVKGQIRLLQSIGRILRKANDKNEVVLVDVVDNLEKKTAKKTSKNTLLKQFLTRLEIYEAQEFEYGISKVKI